MKRQLNTTRVRTKTELVKTETAGKARETATPIPSLENEMKFYGLFAVAIALSAHRPHVG